MIITRTPLRMSFVGGGSDLPVFYREFGGAVVSTAIDKYVYVTVNKKFDNHIRVSYSKTEEVESVDKIEHNIVREVLKLLNMTGGIEITSVADIPSKGTGLGSSSSFTVALLHALEAYMQRTISAKNLGELSCQIEIDICKEPIGKQDQYAAAYGGLNFIQFNQDDSVFVDKIICKKATIQEIFENTLVFYTGISRSASHILKEQSEEIKSEESKKHVMKQMVQLAFDLKKEIENNNLTSFGEILHVNWLLKKQMSGSISNLFIDECYDLALKSGAIGGKILGAGAGGFLMLYAPKENHPMIVEALSHLTPVSFDYEPQGSKVIFIH
ncbi:GHMP family kinase ATP-binding protein [Pigmentibacter ruber]